MATADHLMILNALLNQVKTSKKKELYIEFLDVTKAKRQSLAKCYNVHNA